MADGEEWRPVPGWPEYEYSPVGGGQVRSVDRVLPNGRRVGGVLLAQATGRKGYRRVTLCRSGIRRTIPVHVIAALVLIGERPPGQHVLHRKDDRSRNDQTVRYGTQSENERDKKRRRRRKRINSEKESTASRALTNIDLGIPRSGQ